MAVKPSPVKRADGVRWRVRFRLPGAENATSETFSSQPEAQRFIDLAVRNGTPDSPAWTVAREIRHGSDDPIGRIPTLATYLDTYLDRAAASCTPGTVALYRRVATLSWLTMLGDYPLDMITRDLVLRWLTWQRRQETARSARIRARAVAAGDPPPAPQVIGSPTIAGYQRLLSTVLAAAVEDGYMPRNVARGVRVPDDTERAEKTFLTPAEFAAIYAQVPEYWRPLVAILAGTGMRFGEATALYGSDFDLDAPVPIVRVTRSWKVGERDGRYLGSPKSKAGRRTVSLSATIVAVVRPLVEAHPGAQRIFTGPDGGDVSISNWRRRVWNPAVTASGIAKRPRIHDLRHSHISHLIAQGVPLPVIQRRVGHEKITTTVDIYGHLAPDALMDAAFATESAMAGSIPAPPQITT